jgi:hypothetical protein
MKFKVGDRVSVYGHSKKGCKLNGFYGQVRAVDQPGTGWLEVYWDCDDWEPRVEWVHEKQCRRLKKKERRRCWLNPALFGFGAIPADEVGFSVTPAKGFYEFIEVKRK